MSVAEDWQIVRCRVSGGHLPAHSLWTAAVSEDLDFILQTLDPDFHGQACLKALQRFLLSLVLLLSWSTRSRADRTGRQAMLKDDSLGGQLNLKFADLPPSRKLRIKLEMTPIRRDPVG